MTDAVRFRILIAAIIVSLVVACADATAPAAPEPILPPARCVFVQPDEVLVCPDTARHG